MDRTAILIAMLAPTAGVFRTLAQAHRYFNVDASRAYSVRKRFRALVYTHFGTYQYVLPHAMMRLDGLSLSFFEVGDASCQVSRYYISGKRHGLHTVWRFTGVLYEQYSYINDKKHGVWRVWHDNGVVSIEVDCLHDRANGMYRSWDENGRLRVQHGYVDGRKCGKYRSWHHNGQPYIQCEYLHDNVCGDWKIHDVNGQLRETV